MSSTTTNLGLTKPASGESYSLDVVNGNTQKIDDFAGGVNTNLAKLNTAATYASNQNLNNYTTTGSYHVGTDTSSSPTGATIYGILVVYSAHDTIVQIFIRTDNTIFTRAKANASSSWSSWKPITGWTDITTQFTVNTTYCSDFHAYTDGHQVYFSCYAKTGTPDQTNLVTNIASAYRPKVACTASAFWMNWTDSGKSIVAYVMTSAIQIRTVGDLEGSGGVLVSGSYPI